MAQKKESYFWSSYADLMTSLFFVMLVLFVVVIVAMNKRMSTLEQNEAQRQQILKAMTSTKDLDKNYFRYDEQSEKFQLNLEVRYKPQMATLDNLEGDAATMKASIREAGKKIREFLRKHETHKYLVIVEGQASRDNFTLNYELSYYRALYLVQYWSENGGFPSNGEILIAGSGDGRIRTNSQRERNERANQRFLIYLIPKNIIDDVKNTNSNDERGNASATPRSSDDDTRVSRDY